MAIPTLSRSILPPAQRLAPTAEARADTGVDNARRADARYAPVNRTPPSDLVIKAQQSLGETRSQVRQERLEAQRRQQRIEQNEQQRQRATERADSIEQRRARRIREAVEAREVRQQLLSQEAAQARAAQLRETEARTLRETAARARQLQQEALAALRVETARRRIAVASDTQAQAEQPSQRTETAMPAPEQLSWQSAEITVALRDQSVTTPQQAPDNALQADEDVAELIQQEMDIMERLLRQQVRAAELSGQQLDAETSLARSTLQNEGERNARLQRSSSSASRLANFIDLIS